MLGFREYDCSNDDSWGNWLCNLGSYYPQDALYDFYSCLNNESNVIEKDNKMKEISDDVIYPLITEGKYLKPIPEFNMCYSPSN